MQTSDLLLERMMRLHPKVIDLTLGRVERLLAIMGHPERNLPPVIADFRTVSRAFRAGFGLPCSVLVRHY